MKALVRAIFHVGNRYKGSSLNFASNVKRIKAN